MNNIWYLSDDEPVYPPLFGKEHMKNMKISFIKSTSKLEKGKKTVSVPSTSAPPDEGESSQAGPSSHPGPSFTQAAIHSIVETSVQKIVDESIKKAMAPILHSLSVLEKLIPEMPRAFGNDLVKFKSSVGLQMMTDLTDFQLTIEGRLSAISAEQQAVKTAVELLTSQYKNVDTTLDAIAGTMGVSVPSSSQPPPPPVSSSLAVDPVAPPPAVDPVIPPPMIDPSTVPLPSSSSSDFQDPPSSPTAQSSLFVDDKGGE